MHAVTELWRYPVKSMAGERLDTLAFAGSGAAGDRAWALRDEQDRSIRGAKRFPELMGFAARFEHEPEPGSAPPARIRTPSGEEFDSDAHDAAKRMSDALGRPVTLWPLQPADALEHHRRGPPSNPDPLTELRTMFARTDDEPLPDVSAFPPELATYSSPLGTYFDAFPVLIIASSSIDRLARRAPEQRFDVRRFRPNIVLDTADVDGILETGWVGRSLRIGDAVFRGEMACPRCIMTTLGFDDVPRDPRIMRTLVREAGGDLGLYATVTTPGTVRIGDRMTLT